MHLTWEEADMHTALAYEEQVTGHTVRETYIIEPNMSPRCMDLGTLGNTKIQHRMW